MVKFQLIKPQDKEIKIIVVKHQKPVSKSQILNPKSI